MATEQLLEVITLPAGADLSALQYTFVKLDTTSAGVQVIAAASDGDDCIGILQNDPSAAGQAAAVAIRGISKLVTGSAGVTAGDKLQTGSTGQAKTAATTAHHVLGRALQTGTSGDIIRCLLGSNHVLA